MKKIVYLLMLMSVFLIPMSVKANIYCNDGTQSKTCTTCSRGCCSGHKGCATTTYTENNTSASEKNNESVKQQPIEETPKEEPVSTKTENPIVPIAENSSISTEEKEKDDSAFAEGAIILAAAGATVYGVKKRKKKQV